MLSFIIGIVIFAFYVMALIALGFLALAYRCLLYVGPYLVKLFCYLPRIGFKFFKFLWGRFSQFFVHKYNDRLMKSSHTATTIECSSHLTPADNASTVPCPLLSSSAILSSKPTTQHSFPNKTTSVQPLLQNAQCSVLQSQRNPASDNQTVQLERERVIALRKEALRLKKERELKETRANLLNKLKDYFNGPFDPLCFKMLDYFFTKNETSKSDIYLTFASDVESSSGHDYARIDRLIQCLQHMNVIVPNGMGTGWVLLIDKEVYPEVSKVISPIIVKKQSVFINVLKATSNYSIVTVLFSDCVRAVIERKSVSILDLQEILDITSDAVQGLVILMKAAGVIEEIPNNDFASMYSLISIEQFHYYSRIVQKLHDNTSVNTIDEVTQLITELTKILNSTDDLVISSIGSPAPISIQPESIMFHADYDSMNGFEFEQWCAKQLRILSFSNVVLTKNSGDQGVDILAEKNGVRYAIQCKCYNHDIGNKAVQEVYAGKAFYNCQSAVVMTNRYFTPSAKELANSIRVLLWDRDWLYQHCE